MKKAIVFTIKSIGVLLALLVMGCLLYIGFYEWRQTLRYSHRITIKATYMQYACGDCSLDMKVKTVDNPEYNFIIGSDVFPNPATKNKEELCDYVGENFYNAVSGQRSFELTGYLHKYAHGIPLFGCTEPPFFTVEKIRFGNSGKWEEF